MNKNELIKELLSELSYRSNEGYPMLDNREQISILAEILDEWGYTKIKNELIENLLEADDKKFTATKKDTNQTVAFDSEEARDAAIEKGTHTKKEDSEEDDSKKKKKDMFSSEAGYEAPDLKKDDDIDTTPKSKNSKLKKLPKEESIKIDHNSADKSLMMTKTEAKAQAQRTKAGETQNVGAGTPESRAGEAMVHKGLRLLQSGKSLEEIEEEFSKIVNSDDHILNSKTGKKWVSSTLSSLKKIDEVIGIENIQDVAWDTDAGRIAIGVDPNLETSSDMFVRTKDGKNIGLSLKKDGNVFLNNGGWAKQSKLLLGDLKSQMGNESHKKLSEAMSIKAYEDDLTDRFKSISSTITVDTIKEDFERLKNEPEILKKYFGGSNQPIYFREMENPEVLHRNMVNGNLSKYQQKVLAKLTQAYHKEEYNHLRKSEDALTERTFNILNSDKEAKEGMNKHIIKSMHITETLGLNKTVKEGGVDGFQTMYGIEPDGAVLNEQTLITLFGSNFQNILQEQIKEVRDGKKSVKELEKAISDSIEIDYESGQILFKHESQKKFPLFKLQGRARGIGASPTMEMLQTPFMAHALKMGTFNTDEWDTKSLERFKKDIEFI
jgi:hypothetical protein|tara:strand:- start:452 stop:2275 length:1824 start_codon:yes stop_codon:yes gene_type:complete